MWQHLMQLQQLADLFTKDHHRAAAVAHQGGRVRPKQSPMRPVLRKGQWVSPLCKQHDASFPTIMSMCRSHRQAYMQGRYVLATNLTSQADRNT